MSCSLSTHVLDTGTGRPAAGVAVELLASGDTLPLASGTTDADGRISPLADDLAGGPYRLVFHPSPFFTRIELQVELIDGHYHVPLLVSAYGVRELPRQLTLLVCHRRVGRATACDRPRLGRPGGQTRRDGPRQEEGLENQGNQVPPRRATAAVRPRRAAGAVRGPDAVRGAARRQSRTRSSARGRSSTSFPRREARDPRRTPGDRSADRAVGPLDRRAGLRRRPGGARRACASQCGVRGAPRLPLRRLRESSPEGGDPRGAPQPDRNATDVELETALDELVAIAEDRWRRG